MRTLLDYLRKEVKKEAGVWPLHWAIHVRLLDKIEELIGQERYCDAAKLSKLFDPAPYGGGYLAALSGWLRLRCRGDTRQFLYTQDFWEREITRARDQLERYREKYRIAQIDIQIPGLDKENIDEIIANIRLWILDMMEEYVYRQDYCSAAILSDIVFMGDDEELLELRYKLGLKCNTDHELVENMNKNHFLKMIKNLKG